MKKEETGSAATRDTDVPSEEVERYRRSLMRLDKWHLETVAFHICDERGIKWPEQCKTKAQIANWCIERELEA